MPYRKYLRAINNKFGFLATWLPNQKIALGDIGTFEKGVFRRHESLAGLGHDLEEDTSGVPIDFDHSSASSISFGFGAQVNGAASTVGNVQDAKAQIEFGESGSFVLRAAGCIEHSLVSRAALRRAVSSLRESGHWRDEWVVIDQLYIASSLTLVVCNSSSGALTLSASASAGAAQFDIARADLGVSASRWAGDLTKDYRTKLRGGLF
jgi:hypothetical protein